ncbi:MAG: hypothetical protein Unbinned6354contig1000_49 [Prokaryotic dsDNA virus sp.]|nr:hypothetical protein [Cytophagaceae bacterium]QDP54346.1 MAG: hypothetical protein Unbinned6354contig1000_49 [Prokaryotic dsDNA virus sp.]|tara:strand:- start:4517 stop:4825 length:309 start_codon:yes stop_codon:yes gene_type:complete
MPKKLYEKFDMTEVLKADIADNAELVKVERGNSVSYKEVLETFLDLDSHAHHVHAINLKSAKAMEDPKTLELINENIRALKQLRAYILTRQANAIKYPFPRP